MSDRTRCAECNEPFRTRGPEDGKKLAMFAVEYGGGLTSALLCGDCHGKFKERGTSGIPNAAAQARDGANAAKNRRDTTPLAQLEAQAAEGVL